MINRADVIPWSLLNPAPLCYYHESTRSHVVYWQGVAMTRLHAMILVQEFWIQTFATPQMKMYAFNEFKRMYYTGGFGKVNWHNLNEMTQDNYMAALRKFIQRHDPERIPNLVKNYDIKEAMMWFSPNNEEIIVDD
jgi:hypothetical protein